MRGEPTRYDHMRPGRQGRGVMPCGVCDGLGHVDDSGLRPPVADAASGLSAAGAVAWRACPVCHGAGAGCCEEQAATSCIIPRVALAYGRVLPRIRFRPLSGTGTGDRCADCNVAPGGLHHVGCRQEVCPSCGQRAGVCGFRL
jgi:hypothetical protein